MREEEVAAKSRNIQVIILQWLSSYYIFFKSSGDISSEPVRGQKIEEHVVTDWDVRNDENRPSLTSGAAAGERQAVSSKNTTDELSDAITGGKDIGLVIQHAGKSGNIGWKRKSNFQNIMFHKTEACHGNAPQIFFVARTTTAISLKEAGFVFLLHELVFIVSRVDWCARIRLNMRTSVLEKSLRLEARRGATSNQWNI